MPILDAHARRVARLSSFADRYDVVERTMAHLDDNRYSFREQLLAIYLADALRIRREARLGIETDSTPERPLPEQVDPADLERELTIAVGLEEMREAS